MTQEDKKLLITDLCARLPYGVKAESVFINPDTKEHKSCGIEVFDATSILMIRDGLGEFKPYLFPLSSMTEEQMEELEELCNMYTPDDDYHPYAYMGIEVLYKHVLDDGYKFSSAFNTDVVDWFNKKHFDYRGLIEKGLAIDATNKNIY